MESPNKAFLGMSLRRDLFNHNGVFIAPARTLLNEEQIELIDRHGIQLESHDVQAVEKKPAVQGQIDSTTAYVTELFDKIRYSKTIPLLTIREEIVPVIQQTAGHTDFYELIATLQTKDDYTYRHNIAVGVLSTLIGRWMGLPHSELTQLTLAATLHDIGKLKIPPDLLLKPGKLTHEEFELIKKHTIFGYQMIKDTVGATHLQALVALQHHERQDGSGYLSVSRQGRLFRSAESWPSQMYFMRLLRTVHTGRHLPCMRPCSRWISMHSENWTRTSVKCLLIK